LVSKLPTMRMETSGIPGLFPGETAVGSYGRWYTREERWVEWFEEEIKIGQVGEAVAWVVPMSNFGTRKVKRGVQLGGLGAFMAHYYGA
jgi:hypothetical protein